MAWFSIWISNSSNSTDEIYSQFKVGFKNKIEKKLGSIEDNSVHIEVWIVTAEFGMPSLEFRYITAEISQKLVKLFEKHDIAYFPKGSILYAASQNIEDLEKFIESMKSKYPDLFKEEKTIREAIDEYVIGELEK